MPATTGRLDVTNPTEHVIGTTRGRLAPLDGLRALAFLSVFVNHGLLVPMAWVGVDLFFVLSGFLITTILLEAKGRPAAEFFGRFYRRRARRILPPYLLVLGLVAIVGGNVQWPRVWWYFFTFTQNWPVAAFQPLVGTLFPYWSLAVEEQFYIVWPVLCFALSRRQLAIASMAIMCLAPIARAIWTPRVPVYTIIFCLTPFRMDLLAAGGLLALWVQRRADLRAKRFPPWYVPAFFGVIFFGPALVFHSWRASANSEMFNVLGYSVSVLMNTSLLAMVLSAPADSLVSRLLSIRWLTQLGRISYTCYLLHAPVLYFTIPAVGRIVGSIAGLVITVCLAALSWRWIERPLLERRGGPIPSPATA